MVIEKHTGIEKKYFDKAKRYQILGILGTGNFGIVYRVYDNQWDEEVALKTTRDETPEQKQWLKEEYRIQSDIAHPVLVPPDELRMEGERYYFTMKLIEAALSFKEYFALRREEAEPGESAVINQVCTAALELAEGLQTIHSLGRCHGDIKPENVLITKQGKVALLDFGLMRSTSHGWGYASETPGLVGTPTYLAPEQYEGMVADAESDWYALGLMLYETLTGAPAFSGDPLEVLIAKQMSAPSILTQGSRIPASLGKLVDSMIDPIRDKRPLQSDIVSVLQAHASLEPDQPVSEENSWQSNDAHLDDSFIARVEEIATIQNAYERIREGGVSLLEVTGPSGIGKSALVRHFLETTRDVNNTLIFQGKCLPHESIPYKAFDAIIDGLTNYWLSLDSIQSEELVPSTNAASMVVLFPELRRIAALDSVAKRVTRFGDPRTLRTDGFAALREVFTTLAKNQDVVLWIDDSQWADSDSAALLEGVFAHQESVPVFLLLTRRPDDEVTEDVLRLAIDKIPPLNRTQLDLLPLTFEACESLVRSIIGPEGVDADSIKHIIDQSAGLPYLVSELSHYAKRQGGKIRLPDGDSVGHSILAERLTTLPLENSVIVELVAVAAAPLSPAVIMQAAESGQRYRLRDLTILRLLRWATDGEEHALQIYHDHLREFVVSNLNSETLIKRHGALLTAMEDDGSYDAESLLPHALASGNKTRARYHALSAASRASEALAFEQAARFYETAIQNSSDDKHDVELLAAYADALANAGRSIESAPAYERALSKLEGKDSEHILQRSALTRRAGEQYLKSGHFIDGLRIMSTFLKEKGVHLPASSKTALFISASRRVRLYFTGFSAKQPPAQHNQETITRLDDLWAATTALSMMDPVRADVVGLLHFLESLKAGNKAHIARSMGYEAAFAALIGGPWLCGKANQLLSMSAQILSESSDPYDRAFYHLGSSSVAFFNCDWASALSHGDLAAKKFRAECKGAEYEAAVAEVHSFQALGQAGNVKELVRRLPVAIKEADERGDLFAANSYRGGFHALGRIAAGQLDAVNADLKKVVETRTPGFYQMYAYHSVFAAVNAALYQGNQHAALARIEDEWTELRNGLFLTMALPAAELRWALARACLAVAQVSPEPKQKKLLRRVRTISRSLIKASVAVAKPHGVMLNAGICALTGDRLGLIANLRMAVDDYTKADMQIHQHVARWALAELLTGEESERLKEICSRWQQDNDVPAMLPLVATLAPGVTEMIKSG